MDKCYKKKAQDHVENSPGPKDRSQKTAQEEMILGPDSSH